MWPGRKRTQDHLNDYWNARIRRAPAEELAALSGEIEPATAAAIDGVHSLLHRLPPDPAFVARLEQQIMSAYVASTTPEGLSLPVTSLAPTNGRTTPHAPSGWLPALPTARTHRRLALLSLAAALLMLLAGIGSYFAWDAFSGNDSAPAVIPAVQDSATPGTDWPMYRGNSARTGVMPGTGPKEAPGEVWRVQLDGSAFRSPIVVGDTAYVGTSQGTLHALDANTGAEQWVFNGDGPMEMTPAYLDGVVYAPSQVGTLYAIDAATGEQLWQFAEPLAEFATPTFADGLLVVGSEVNSAIYGIDPTTGEEVWSFETAGPVTRGQAYADGLVFSGSQGGILYALNAEDGTEVWQYDARQDFIGTPSVSNGVVCITSPDGFVILVDAATGDEITRIETPSSEGISSPPTVDGNMVYVGGFDASIIAVDIASMQVQWAVETGDMVRAALALVNGVVYGVGMDGVVYALDAATGDTLWTHEMDGSMDFGPTVGNGMVYVSTDAGSVVALGDASDSGAQSAPAATPESESTPVAETTGIDQSQVALVWSTSDPDGAPIGTPHGMDIAPNGNIYVGDVAANVIHVLAPDGTLLETWGEPGTGTGQFSGPEDIGFDADGNIYVIDIGNSRVQKFSPDHSFLLEWGTSGTGNGEFSQPHGFVDRQNGLVYIVEFLGSRVQVFDLDGNFIDKWGGAGPENGQFRQPATVSVDAEGNVYVAETNNGSNSRVQKFDSLGTWQATIGGTSEEFPASFSEVWGIAFDANGNMYVADYFANSIEIFGPDLQQIGEITDIPGAGPLNHPLRIHFDAEGFLYIVDWDNQRVLKVSVPLPMPAE